MKGFPSHTPSARKGEKGVRIVSTIVNDEFGWIFRGTHQEADFGIDGYLEVVTSGNVVTGQMLACQIKFGKSFFLEKDRFGWLYRGETKHFDYLANFPLPVLIIICNPDDHRCFWTLFDPLQTTKTKDGWKISVPFSTDLKENKSSILSFVPDVVDAHSQMREYWEENSVLQNSDFIMYEIMRKDVRSKNAEPANQFLLRLMSNKQLAYHCKGKVEFSVEGYDNDRRELWEIGEFRRFAPILDGKLEEIFFSRTAKLTVV